MTKSDFATYMSRLRDIHDSTRRLEDALEPFVLCVGAGFSYGYERLFFDLLRSELCDSDGWLEFFTRDRDWLRRNSPVLYDIDGHIVSVDTWGDVYDFIVDHHGDIVARMAREGS